MKKSRFTESQIVAILKEGEAGASAGDLSRKHGISRAIYFHWRSKHGVPANVRRRGPQDRSVQRNHCEHPMIFGPPRASRVLRGRLITEPGDLQTYAC
jgi:transposase-like protein